MKPNILPSIYGGIIGDALGVPVEFSDRNVIALYPVTDMREFGSHHQPRGTWSDDTSMTLATMDALSSSLPLVDAMHRFQRWMLQGAYTPHGITFDIGNTTRKAIQAYQTTNRFSGLTDAHSNGNGSLMRMLPVVLSAGPLTLQSPSTWNLWTPSDLNTLKKACHDWSALTHAHPLSLHCCYYYACLLQFLFQGYSPQESLLLTQRCSARHCPDKTVFQRLYSPSFSSIPVDEIASSGYVVDTLEAAIWCFLQHNTYHEIVLSAVNLGEDTDTIGELAGQLAGATYGLDSQGNQWKTQLTNQPFLTETINAFYRFILPKWCTCT